LHAAGGSSIIRRRRTYLIHRARPVPGQGETMRRPVLSALVAGAFAVLAGCASTQLSTVWKDPNLGKQPFQKVMVIAMAQEESVRRSAEDAFVRALAKGKTQAVASYTVFPQNAVQDTAALKQLIGQSGCDGVVVYRLVGVDKSQDYVPGAAYYSSPYYSSFYGYYGWSAPTTYSPGYVVENTTVVVESAAYTLNPARLLWTARSETFNPSNAQTLIKDVTSASVSAMKGEGLIR
jgi:hypothetical protein